MSNAQKPRHTFFSAKLKFYAQTPTKPTKLLLSYLFSLWTIKFAFYTYRHHILCRMFENEFGERAQTHREIAKSTTERTTWFSYRWLLWTSIRMAPLTHHPWYWRFSGLRPPSLTRQPRRRRWRRDAPSAHTRLSSVPVSRTHAARSQLANTHPAGVCGAK